MQQLLPFSATPPNAAIRPSPWCPFCALHHTRSAHRSQNPTGTKGGNFRPISGCCPTSHPHCPNCGGDHDAFSRECQARPTPPPRREAPPSDAGEPEADSEVDIEIGDDGGQAPSPPEATTAQAVDLTTPLPSRRGVTSTSGAAQPMGGPSPPDTHRSRRVRPGNDSLRPYFETQEEAGPVPRHHSRSTQQPGQLGCVSFLIKFLCWFTSC